ncbi:MAG TPA: ABC transporter ATP-binding protein [Bacteroidales bacterium]|nr:ABC transporter ATP-binding protein [Bacteroidales bacterium]
MLAELQQVTKYYGLPGSDQSSRVLHEISLQIAECENIAIVGPSGSGKSTLLNILGTLDSPTSGRVLLKGISVNDMDESRLAETRNKDIGFVFQMHYLLPQLTLLENILLPLLPQKDKILQKNAHEQALQLIHRVGLSKQLHKFPSQLSGGECQRTAVVRALINKPRLLLADEPTGSLDAANASQLADLLAELNKEQGVAMVIVTHSMELAGRSDKIYRLQEGKLIAGKP